MTKTCMHFKLVRDYVIVNESINNQHYHAIGYCLWFIAHY
jgi:hypothetical protein